MIVQDYLKSIAKPVSSSLWDCYREHPLDHRRIIWVLSVIYEGVSQTLLKEMIDRLGWTSESGDPLSELLVKPLRLQLTDEQLILQQHNQLRCHPDLVEMVTREAVKAGAFDAIAEVTEKFGLNKSAFIQVATEDAHIRRLRVALYSGNPKGVFTQLGLKTRQRDPKALEPLMKICFIFFDEDWFDTLDVDLKFVLFARLLDDAAYYLEDASKAWSLALRYLDQEQNQEIRSWLAEQWLFRGRVDRAEPLLPGEMTSESLTLFGWIRFLQGANLESIDTFRRALGMVRKETRKRNVYLKGFGGICYVLALLREDQPAMLEEARKQTGMAIKLACDDYFEPIYRMLDDAVTVFRGEMQLHDSVWLARESLAVEPYFDLLRVLARRWLEGDNRNPADDKTDKLNSGSSVEKTPDRPSRLPKYCKIARQGGWMWYAIESALLLERDDAKQCQDLVNAVKTASFRPITSLIRVQEPWERALLALRGVSEPGLLAGDSGEPELRMSWRLSFLDDNQVWIEPKEQKRSKRGGWTKGRTVSLEKLFNKGADFDYLTLQDRQICQTIQTEVVYEYYGRYPKTVYNFDLDQAIQAAVDHPLLFWADDTDRPLELVRENPALEIHKTRGKLLLKLQPHPPSVDNTLVEQQGPRRIRVVCFNNEHRRIAEILGEKGLTVPVSAKEKVLESIVAIAPLLNIHSDIGVGGAASEHVEAHTIPHVHLKPVGDGISMDCYIQPFGDQGPVFRPGEGRSTVFTDIDGTALHTERNRQAEEDAANQVLLACPALSPEAEWSWLIEEPEAALDTLLALQEMGDVIVLDWPQGKRIKLTNAIGVSSMSLRILKQSDWFSLDGELRIDENRVIAMKDLLGLLDKSDGRFIRLGDNEFLTLTRDLRKRIDALRDLGDDGKIHPLAIQAVEELTTGMTLKTSQAWQDQLDRLEDIRDLEPELPSTLCAELREYQLEGFQWLSRLSHWGAGACLADDMGLGKTIQALSIILARAPNGPTLVLAPTSVCTNWLEEADKFAPTLKIARFGPGDRDSMIREAGPYDLIVCSYGLMQTEAELLGKLVWSTIVADEAQAIKNTMTKRSRAAMSLKAGFKLITTGTPIENHLGELWNLFRFINPGLLGSLDQFNQRFAGPIEQQNDFSAKQRLRLLIRPFILRRLKSEVLTELPERTEITLHVELSDDEMVFYQALRVQALERVKKGAVSQTGQQRIRILAEITKLRQACCNPRLVLKESTLPSAKLLLFGEIIEELIENRHKALVFSQFVGHLRLLREYLDKKGIFYQYLDGSTSIKKRADSVKAFQRGEGDLFLISLKAGGSGLNLTAADYVIHMDPWWNPAVEDQASDRAHRIGQQRPVTIYRLIAKNTIEDKIVKLHAHKRDLADNLLEGSDMSGRMTVEDMIGLLKDGVEGE